MMKMRLLRVIALAGIVALGLGTTAMGGWIDATGGPAEGNKWQIQYDVHQEADAGGAMTRWALPVMGGDAAAIDLDSVVMPTWWAVELVDRAGGGWGYSAAGDVNGGSYGLDASDFERPGRVMLFTFDVAGKVDRLAKLQGLLDNLNSTNQLNMIQLQSLMSKRNQAYEMASNMLSQIEQSRRQLILRDTGGMCDPGVACSFPPPQNLDQVPPEMYFKVVENSMSLEELIFAQMMEQVKSLDGQMTVRMNEIKACNQQMQLYNGEMNDLRVAPDGVLPGASGTFTFKGYFEVIDGPVVLGDGEYVAAQTPLVPEPCGVVLLGMGVMGVVGRRR